MINLDRKLPWSMLVAAAALSACGGRGASTAPADASDTSMATDHDAGSDRVTPSPDAGSDGVVILQVPPMPITSVSPGQSPSVTLSPPQPSGNPCGWLGVESATAAAFTPDGALLVTGAADGLRVYDAHSGAPVRAMSAGRGTVQPLSPSSDGSLVGAVTGSPSVYRIADGSTVFAAPPEMYGMGPAALSPDGTHIAFQGSTLASTGNVDIWSVASGQRTSTLVVSPTGTQVGGVTYSPGGDLLAVSLVGGHLQLWSVVSGQKLVEITVQISGSTANYVGPLSFSPDGAFLGLSSDAGGMIYHVPALTPLTQASVGGSPAFSADSKQFAATSVVNGIDIALLKDATAPIVVEHIAPALVTTLLAFSRADDHVALAGPHALAVQSLGTSQIIWSADGDPGVSAVAPDARGFYGINQAGELRSWSARGQIQSVSPTPFGPRVPISYTVSSFDISRDGHRLAALGSSAVETLSFDQLSASTPLVVATESSVSEQIHFAPDGARVMTVDANGATEWGALDARRLRFFSKDPATTELKDARYSPDGALMVLGGPVMDVWRRSDGTLLRRLQSTAPLASLDSLAFSPSGALLATCDYGGTLSLWDTSSWTMPVSTRPYTERCSVIFTADGKGVLTWSETDGAVRLWRATDLSPVAAMPNFWLSAFVGVTTANGGQQVAGVAMFGEDSTFLYCLPAVP
jgi:WD40 repeat protein